MELIVLNNETRRIDIDISKLKIVRCGTLNIKDEPINKPHQAYNAIKELIEDEAQEVFVIMCLSTKNRPLKVFEISRGTLDATMIHPREVFKAAMLCNASSIIAFHNHPSGYVEPSPDDINASVRLAEAGKLLGIKLYDHIIIGDENFVSLKDKGIV